MAVINDGPVNVCVQFFSALWTNAQEFHQFPVVCFVLLIRLFSAGESLHMLTSILSLIASHPLIFSLKILSFLFIMLKIESYIRQVCTLPLSFTPALSLIFSDFSMWLILLLRRLSPSRSSSVKLLVCLGSLAILILGYALLHYFSCLATKSLLLCRLLREFSLLTEEILFPLELK